MRDIVIFRRISDTRISENIKIIKNMDPPDKDPHPYTLKFPGYPILPMPMIVDNLVYSSGSLIELQVLLPILSYIAFDSCALLKV